MHPSMKLWVFSRGKMYLSDIILAVKSENHNFEQDETKRSLTKANKNGEKMSYHINTKRHCALGREQHP